MRKSIFIITFIFLFVLLTGCGGSLLTDEQKDDRIGEAYVQEGYDAAVKLVYEYYGTSDKALSWMMALSDIEEEDVLSQVQVSEQSMDKDGDWLYYEATVTNNSSETLSYIKIDVFLYNKSGVIIDSKWTNWSGTLPPGGSAKLDTMLKYDPDVSKYNGSVSDVSTK